MTKEIGYLTSSLWLCLNHCLNEIEEDLALRVALRPTRFPGLVCIERRQDRLTPTPGPLAEPFQVPNLEPLLRWCPAELQSLVELVLGIALR